MASSPGMRGFTNLPGSTAGPEALAQVDQLLDRIVELAQSDVSQSKFLGELLAAVVEGVAGQGGIAWPFPVSASQTPLVRVGFAPGPGGEPHPVEKLLSDAAHRHLVQQVGSAGTPRRMLPGWREASDETAVNRTDSVLLLAPVQTAGQPTDAVLEVVIPAGGSPAAQQAALDIVAAFAEVAERWFDRQRLINLRARVSRFDQWNELVTRVHGSLDPSAVAFALANEGRVFLGCDRLSVIAIEGRRPRLLAVSGQDLVDRRTPQVRAIEELARIVAAARAPVSLPDESLQTPPQVAAAAQLVCDLSAARELFVWPLVASRPEDQIGAGSREPAARLHPNDGESVGVLVAENWNSTGLDSAGRERYELLAQQGTLALQNCRELRSVPLFSVLSPLGRILRGRHVSRVWGVGAAITAAALALWLVPAELTVSGTATLQPRKRVDVFAPADGIVVEVLSEHGRECRQGEPVLRLARTELELEQTRVSGELETTRRRLASIEATRLQSEPRNAAEREKLHQIAAEEEELRETHASLLRQQAILDRQEAELVVRSPLDGQVVTWDVQELLASRPVQRGQQLLTVADLRGPWVLEVDVPDERIGLVLSAQRRDPERGLPVSFVLATEPGVRYAGSVAEIAQSAEPDRQAGQRVRVTVEIPAAEVFLRRPGAVVVPRIHCGRFPLGYVWFHTAWETLQKHVFF